MVPYVFNISICAFFYFKLVSPSKFLVSIKHAPFFSLVFSITTSAGKYSFSLIFTISPINISLHLFFTKFPFYKIYTGLLFSSLSEECLFKSSNRSFIMLIPTTKIKGMYINGYPSEVDISFTHYSTPIN